MIGFLDLPGELRNRIYRFLFVEEDAFIFNRPWESSHQHAGQFNKTSAAAQMLRTCKQVYSEGVTILYGENKFAVGFEGLHYFEKTLGQRASYIKTVKIQDDLAQTSRGNMDLQGDASPLQAFPNLAVVVFRGYAAILPEPIGAPKSPEPEIPTPGAIVSKGLIGCPKLVASLSRRFVNTILQDCRLEVKMEVRVFHYFISGAHHPGRNTDPRMDNYKILPIDENAPDFSSNIDQNYNLLFIDSRLC
ncbi:hypothetical protein BLS_000515 [Venturia inaequalis]|uniref:DUF7730 domain-containing protein n=1 Tax=Venturia inaequalis TaxID=5025 RepID=A0A8H3U304_VENIN|nr:hypothetical protein BLS_000515 [Venturia inaequalis]RDI87545.1 hypothetical protein Vi05172_g2589 [Venturia inaequalis]